MLVGCQFSSPKKLLTTFKYLNGDNRLTILNIVSVLTTTELYISKLLQMDLTSKTGGKNFFKLVKYEI